MELEMRGSIKRSVGVVTLEERRMSVMVEASSTRRCTCPDKRTCAVSYSSQRTLWLSRAEGGEVGPDNRHLQNVARNRFRSAQARSHSTVGLDTGEADRRESHAFRQKDFTQRFGALRHAFAR